MNRLSTSWSRRAVWAAVGTAMASSAVWAQAPQHPPMQQGMMSERAPHCPQRHEQMQAQHLERMKNLLQLQPEQQAAWEAYAASMHRQPGHMALAAKTDWDAMNTLQRLDAQAQMRQQHHADAEQRDQATRTFYNSLNAAQQKAFDSLPHAGAGAGHRKMHMHGPHC